jgi:hypothetical protein
MSKSAFKIALEMVMKEAEEAKKPKCPICGGTGSYYMDGDLHKSGGMVPCKCGAKRYG